jgi:hypothetical protein
MFDQLDFGVHAVLEEENADELYRLTVAEHNRPWPEERRQWVPANLESMAPNVFLAAILSVIDVSKLTGSDVVSVMQAKHRLTSHWRAGVLEAMAETAHCVDPGTLERSPLPTELASEEIAAALSLTRRKADHDLGVALDLESRIPQVKAALATGVIDDRKAQSFSAGTDFLDAGTTTEVVDELLDSAPELTTGQLRARLRRLCIEADPEAARKRYARSVDERKVVAEPNDEGTAAFIISQCSPEDVFAARDHVNRIARGLKTADEPRTIDQLRADVAIGLLTGRLQERIQGGGGSVNIRVDLTTLTDMDDRSADLAGYGPVVAEIARKVAKEQAEGEWSATVTDAETGEPLHTVAVRRRPSAAQKRRIRALHPTCSFKGCRMPAVESDIDHIADHARGGPTTVMNQAPLCRRHHLAKHRGGWRYRKVSRTQFEWISPLGKTYLTGRPP